MLSSHTACGSVSRSSADFLDDVENVVTFFPPKEKDSNVDDYHQIADLHNSIFNEVHSPDTPEYTAKDFAALVVSHAVEVLLGWGELIKVDRDLEVFRIFEEYINYLVRNPGSVKSMHADIKARRRGRHNLSRISGIDSRRSLP